MTADQLVENIARFTMLAHNLYGTEPFRITSTHLASLIAEGRCDCCGEPIDADDVFADLTARFPR